MTTPKILKTTEGMFEMKETPFGAMAIPCAVEAGEANSMCIHNLPLIPLELFWLVICWQRNIAKEFNCESHTSLFLIDNEEGRTLRTTLANIEILCGSYFW